MTDIKLLNLITVAVLILLLVLAGALVRVAARSRYPPLVRVVAGLCGGGLLGVAAGAVSGGAVFAAITLLESGDIGWNAVAFGMAWASLAGGIIGVVCGLICAGR
jgi:hypothetical protein